MAGRLVRRWSRSQNPSPDFAEAVGAVEAVVWVGEVFLDLVWGQMAEVPM
jgi:hypothetical protein